MSNTHEPTVEEINAELAKSRLEADARMKTLQEKLEVAKQAEQEKARRAEEAQLEAEAEERAQAQHELEEAQEKAEAEAERQEKEAREKAEAQEKAKAACKVQEAREQTERDNKAERVCRENRKRLYRELIKFKERNEAEERRKAKEIEKNKAGDGMMLATPVDLSAIAKARQINAENAKNQAEGFKPPQAGSSKATPTPTPKPKTPVNLTRQVRNEEAMRKSGKLGKTGDVVVSVLVSSLFGLSDLFSRLSVATCARTEKTSASTGLGRCA
jgi:hypothetical protein